MEAKESRLNYFVVGDHDDKLEFGWRTIITGK